MYKSLVRFRFVKVVNYIPSRTMKDSTKDLGKIRNIGVFAHIDAGKTTTTERMLYYSGRISSMGEVHDGNTVTDYMEQERDRGITIASAFVDLKWKRHTINLVDTPGHIDFTMEVEHALKVIDSAVVILDATAGVEAQTITVWNQVNLHKLPRLVYLNKMDRKNANIDICLKTLQSKLACKPLLLQVPVEGKSGFEGIIDLPSLEKITWSRDECKRSILNQDHPEFDNAIELRLQLIDELSSLDDELADKILEIGSLENITREQIQRAIRNITITQKGIPVVCGSSYKNIGIETLMDSIIDYLPSPIESTALFCNLNLTKETLARSFKIIHDKRRGATVFLRVYSGELHKSQKVYNVNKKVQDQIGRILVPFAEDFKEIPEALSDSIIAVTGLKDTMTGDLICGSQNELKIIIKKLEKANQLTAEEIQRLFDDSQNIPKPVFFCSVEPPSQAYQTALEKALFELQREDPSLQIVFDEATGQTILAGMGELHLDIVKDRIKSSYNIDVDLGKIQIAYKEEFCTPVKHTITLKNSIGSHEQNILLTMSLKPGERKEILTLDMTGDSGANLTPLSPKVINKLKTGVKAALKRGPLYSSEVINVHAVLHWLEAHRATPDSLIVAAASQCIQEILKNGETRLLEPIMKLNITLPSEYCNMVASDLSRRRGIINEIIEKELQKEIICETPLSGLLGYSSQLRSMTSGTANLSMVFFCYRPVSSEETQLIINGTDTSHYNI